MRKFKQHWQITQNWQLIFPFLGLLGLGYSGYKLAFLLVRNSPNYIILPLGMIIAYGLLRFCLYVFNKLEHKWAVAHRWEMIRIFLVFALTGSCSVLVVRPILAFFGISKDNLNDFGYYPIFVLISLCCYQLLLVTFGWLLGQGKFFWEFEKKMLSKLGLGFLFKH